MHEMEHLKSLVIQDPVLKILANQATRLQKRAYLVGGYVRDSLLGLTPKDADLMFEGEGLSETLGGFIAEKFGSTLVRFEKHMVVYRITVLDHQYDLADLHDQTMADDQLRRDFTINSLAVEIGSLVQNPSPCEESLLDASTGMRDLHDQIIRINSESVLNDDPLRIVRMFRFKTQLGFEIDPQSLEMASKYVNQLHRISGERVRDELFQILNRPKSSETLLQMDSIGILSKLFPNIDEMRGVSQNEYHHLDVFDHTMDSIRQIEDVIRFDLPSFQPFRAELLEHIHSEIVPGRKFSALMKLALLFHDIAKPRTRGVRDDGKVTFINHNKLGVDMIEPDLEYLHLSRKERTYINMMVEGHLRPGFLNPASPTLSRAIFRYFDQYGDWGVDLVVMSVADRLAAQGEKVDDDVNERHDKAATILLDAYYNRNKILVRPPDLIDGDDLMAELKLKPGREIGILLRIVKEAQAAGEVNTKAEAIACARSFFDLNAL
jgi:poly(A) polymerase